MVQRSAAALVLMAAGAVAQTPTASPGGPGIVACSDHTSLTVCDSSFVLGGYTHCYWRTRDSTCYDAWDAWDVNDALAAWLVAVIVIGVIILLSVIACVLIGCFCWNNNGRKTVVVMQQQQPPPMQPVMGTYAYHNNNGPTVGVPASSAAPLPYQTPYPQHTQEQQPQPQHPQGQYVPPPPPQLGEQPPLTSHQQEEKEAVAPLAQ